VNGSAEIKVPTYSKNSEQLKSKTDFWFEREDQSFVGKDRKACLAEKSCSW
jgi:hypothetical protein